MVDKKGHPIRIGDKIKFHEFGMLIIGKVVEKDGKLLLESNNGKHREMYFYNDTLTIPSGVVVERTLV